MDRLINAGIEEMQGISFSCGCGKRHSVGIKKIVVKKDSLSEIISIARGLGNGKVFMFADNNTFDVYGKKVRELMIENGFDLKLYVFNTLHPLVPDEKALGRLLVEIEKETTIIIVVGSGSLNDLARMISFKTGIPYIVAATAPSMDGYTSTVSPLIVDGFKSTYEAVYPLAVIADLEVLRNAPDKMIQAGFGDVLGKFTALADWKLSRDLNGEYYCDTCAGLMSRAIDKCVSNVDGIANRDADAVKYLTEALLLSGISMGMVGNSRPASGSEHHLAHFWEMYALANGLEHPLHGNSVGVGTVVSAYLYQLLGDRLGTEMNVPSPEYIRSLLLRVGACDNPFGLGIKKEVFRESVMNAYKIRPRYTVFHFALEKGLLEEFADILTEKFYGHV